MKREPPHSFDLAIENGTVVADGWTGEAAVFVSGGRIAAIVQPSSSRWRPPARRHIDAQGCLVVPGGVDGHTHIHFPIGFGRRSADTWESGTIAAAIGGTTTVVDFVPGTGEGSLLEAFEDRRQEAESAAVIDYAFHSTVARVDRATLREIRLLTEAGVASFKIFTCGPLGVDDGSILMLMQAIGTANGCAGFHAENDAILSRAGSELAELGRLRATEFPSSRPPIAEEIAVQAVLHMAMRYSTRVHIFHLSTSGAAVMIDRARASRVPVTTETCPHYLLFSSEVYQRRDAVKYLIAPPIREDSDRTALWKALSRGSIGSVASDSIAYDYRTKTAASEDFRSVPLGAAGIQLRPGLMFRHGVTDGRLTTQEWVQLTSTGAAKAFGLYPRKGSIRIGSDADIAVIDPRKTVTVSPETTSMGVDYTIYDGMECAGWPRAVISRGDVIVEDGNYVGKSGRGRFIEASYAAADENG